MYYNKYDLVLGSSYEKVRLIKMLIINKLFYFCIVLMLITLASMILPPEANSESKNSQTHNKNGEIQKSGSDNSNEKIESDNSAQPDLKVFIDPDTGELLSQEQAIDRGLVEPENSLNFDLGIEDDEIIIDEPDGSTTIIHPESSQFSNKVKIDEKGNLTSECVTNHGNK